MDVVRLVWCFQEVFALPLWRRVRCTKQGSMPWSCCTATAHYLTTEKFIASQKAQRIRVPEDFLQVPLRLLFTRQVPHEAICWHETRTRGHMQHGERYDTINWMSECAYDALRKGKKTAPQCNSLLQISFSKHVGWSRKVCGEDFQYV